jgi:hypothetical protein
VALADTLELRALRRDAAIAEQNVDVEFGIRRRKAKTLPIADGMSLTRAAFVLFRVTRQTGRRGGGFRTNHDFESFEVCDFLLNFIDARHKRVFRRLSKSAFA